MGEVIVIFRSHRFDIHLTNGNRYPPGEECAKYVVSLLRDLAIDIRKDSIFIQISGWGIDDIKYQDKTISIHVQWVAIGKPPVNYWAIRLHQNNGILQWIHGADAEVLSALSLSEKLQRRLCDAPDIEDVRLLSEAEWRMIY